MEYKILTKTFRPYSIGISSIPRTSHFYSGGWVWAEATEIFSCCCLIGVQKKWNHPHKKKQRGNTFIRKKVRQNKKGYSTITSYISDFYQ